MRTTPSPLPGRSAFTLVELLVSMAVLALVVLAVGQMLSSSQQTISVMRKLLDCDDQVRLAFGRLQGDFDKLVKRNDVDYIFAKQSGASATSGANDKIFFYSQSVGDNTGAGFGSPTIGQNPVSLVGYTVTTDPNIKTNIPVDLQRLGRGLNWLSNGGTATDNMVFLTPAASSPPYFDVNSTLDYHWSVSGGAPYNSIGTAPTYSPTAATIDPDYHVIGDQIFRLEYCFLLRDGSYSDYPIEENSANVPASTVPCVITTTPPTASSDNAHTFTGGGVSSKPVATGTRWFDTNAGRAYICTNPSAGLATWQGLGVQDVAAVVVAIAVLDRTNRNLLFTTGGASAETSLAAEFVDSAPGLNAAGYVSPTDASNPAKLMLMQQAWLAAINSGSIGSQLSGATTVPAQLATKIAGNIRIYQRYFYLNTANAL